MTEINLHQPGRIDATLSIPSSWNELLVDELRLVCAMFLSSFKNPTSIRAAILSGLLSIRSKKHKIKLPKNFSEILDPESAVLNAYPVLDFLFLENNLTEQPFPMIRLPFTMKHSTLTVNGPVSGFDNLTCGEYEDCEIFFYKFRQEPDASSLAHIAAILWRPKETPYIKFANGKKVEYNVDRMVKRFMNLPAWKLYAIFCWYTGCRSALIKLFPTAYKPGKGDPDILAFTKCIHAGAGPKNGSRDQIRMLPVKEYLFDMELEAIKVEELKKQQKK